MNVYLLHQLLASAAARAPERTAVVGQAEELSYGALEEASNRLAHVLRGQGIVKGDRIGIHVDKSTRAVVAIFGILKAGAAYVPLDPAAPAKRTAYVIENCRMRGLITTAGRLNKLVQILEKTPPCVILLDKPAPSGTLTWMEAMQASSKAPAAPGLMEQDLAYILYTSGSTGEPKGVMISHRAALSFVNWAVEYFHLTQEDRLSNHAPLHFDLSVFDVFAAVSAAASVALVPAAVAIFPRNLADWISASRLTVWYSVPSALTQLAIYGGLERYRFPDLRLVLFAGEVFPLRHLRRLMEHIPGAGYFNLYGPTETNVCTVYPVPAPLPAELASLPIGRACANTEVFALNSEGRLSAPGEAGDLHVRGPSLMSGYWGRPEQTRSVLLPDPRHAALPDRVYRTGDLVRLDDSGDYHFIGRRDRQVKSRGYRIELGDVEAVLQRHPAVLEAAVIPLPHEEFGCTLKAVIAQRADIALGRAELVAFCAQHLPPYMTPDNFEFLTALPKTSTGKIDRPALEQATRTE